MGATSAPFASGSCEQKARLENSCKIAQAAFDTARSAIRQKVGTSSKAEYLTLDRAADLAWDQLQRAIKELATHIREHGCGTIEGAPPPPAPQTDLVKQLPVRLFGNAVVG